MAKLTDVQIAAIEAGLRSLELGEAKDNISPGQHGFDFTVNFKGKINKGDDYEKPPTTATPWLAVIGLFVRRSGIQREMAMELIRDAMIEASKVKGDKKAEKLLLEETGVGIAIEAYKKDVISKLPKTLCQGPITSTVTISLVED
jgi:hypothetical protein